MMHRVPALWVAAMHRLKPHVLAVASLLIMIGCSGNQSPTDIDLGVLVDQASAFDGRQVRTQGTLRSLDEPEHLWVENAQLQRVGVDPIENGIDTNALDAVGRTVEVVGEFRYAPEHGRRIIATQLQVID